MEKQTEYLIEIINTKQKASFDANTTCEQIYDTIKDQLKYPCFLVKVDNVYHGLNHVIRHNSQIEFLDITNQACWQVYQNSLLLLFNKAIHDLFVPKIKINVANSLNKGLYITLNKKLNQAQIGAILQRMRVLVDEDLPIIKKHLNKKSTIELATKLKRNETIALLDTNKNVDDIQIYSLGEQVQFLYSQSVPSTKYLQQFDLEIYEKGLILKFPHPQDPLHLPIHQQQPILYNAFRESNRWGNLLGVQYISDINKAIETGRINDLVLMQEGLHEKRIAQIAEDIKLRKSRIILICGPSSSGKTTFAKRLCNQLRIIGIKNIYMGTDDYFLDANEKPLDENGEVDLESINAMDLKLFISNLQDLLAYKEVDLPTFNFIESKKEFGKHITKLEKKQILVIEGIHTLNPLMSQGLEPKDLYKIYISPFTPLGIDSFNRIPTTDARMLRRLIRDNQFRARSPQMVIDEWIKVRKAESVNIFPYHNQADTFFNSNCIYELPLLKKYAQPLLQTITRDQPQYAEAEKMLNLLGFVECMQDDSIVPNTSIMREFIGNSAFVK